MPSSISSSEATGSGAVVIGAAAATADHFERPGFVRQTASDRPGVAQPVPERDVPAQPWNRIFIAAMIAAALLLAGWEAYWRQWDATPGYRNSAGAWAEQRARIDAGEGGGTVLVGTSRLLFDVQLPVWERLAGTRPIQLALEGTSPLPVLEDLAADPDFTGRVVVDVTPDLFFSGYAYRGEAVKHYHERGPSQRAGHWLSKHLLESRLAFYDPDFALPTVVRRQPWPQRPDLRPRTRVRKLMVLGPDRSTHLWPRVEFDPEYRALAQAIWAEDFDGPLPGMDTPQKKQAAIDAQIDRAARAIATLRARGVRVVFVRPPSDGRYYAYEQQHMPRAQTWDALLARTGLPGVHFEDHPAMQGLDLPEWSHLSRVDAERYTATLVPLLEDAFERQEHGEAIASR
jgi:hypothetical protein